MKKLKGFGFPAFVQNEVSLAGTPAGVLVIIRDIPGVLAALDPRLLAEIPAGIKRRMRGN
ncbi:MAG: hypothetical protein NWT08_04320 [Akkermansiaceae bacterium]|nr:hypothetical protein [Akkermansiaceae bacterium]MDP4646103.1 hypothetical protein [Akkermansiaceae bacterium]MDP4720902.1 hypothetical protein [Akkermansiaceae bacterium]MDP4780739.1 hypothetical protein [Akkermansiaceae bacterium]MDP4845685.1 hypothetical protein [Akkermansiaceae bacterium]